MSRFDNLTDEEIIDCIRRNDDAAMDYLLKKYRALVKKETRTMFLIGAETEDLTQEGMIGLFKAVRDYNESRGAAFSTFATMCIRRQVRTAIDTSNRKKHEILNKCVPLSEVSDNTYNENKDLLRVRENEANPEKLLLEREGATQLSGKIEEKLSAFEKKVFKYYLEGLSYSEISVKLNKTEKSVDNALQRIRSKISALLEPI